MHHVEEFQELGAHRHGPVDPTAPLLEGLEHNDLARQIDSAHGQCQRFGQPAAGIVQDVAERADLTRC